MEASADRTETSSATSGTRTNAPEKEADGGGEGPPSSSLLGRETTASSSHLEARTTTTSPQARLGSVSSSDEEYCQEIARRAVSRAALHLGIESMEGVALEVLGDVLVAYLERVGGVMARTVESSGRSSAHCNVLDAVHAVEVCAAPAGCTEMRVGLGAHPSGLHSGDALAAAAQSAADVAAGTDSGSSWERLATFLFGPDWMTIPIPELDQHAPSAQKQPVGAGKANASNGSTLNGTYPNTALGANATMNGGTLPPNGSGGKQEAMLAKTAPNAAAAASVETAGGTSTAESGGDNQDNGEDGGTRNGWNAPFLDPVPAFPLSTAGRRGTRSFAHGRKRPFKSEDAMSRSFHALAFEEEACRVDPPLFLGAPMPSHDHRRFSKHSPHDLGTAQRRGSGNAASAKAKGPGNMSQPTAKSKAPNAKATKPPPRQAETADALVKKVTERADEETHRLPDSAFINTVRSSFWGTPGGTSRSSASSLKRSRGADDGESGGADGDDGRPSKRSRTEETAAEGDKGESNTAGSTTRVSFRLGDDRMGLSTATNRRGRGRRKRRPLYVPPFLPPLPHEGEKLQEAQARSAISQLSATGALPKALPSTKTESPANSGVGRPGTTEQEYGASQQSVRRALVRLGRPVGSAYWGSQQQQHPVIARQDKSESKASAALEQRRLATVNVPTGQAPALSRRDSTLPGSVGGSGGGGVSSSGVSSSISGGAASSSTSGGTARSGAVGDAPPIVPLLRASGSRVSKILEGSMDVFQ